jgi:hypothetical protein
MDKSIWSRRYVRYIGIPLIIVFALYLFWGGSNGFGGGEICAGVCLVLAAGAMVYLKRLENITEHSITQRIRNEYPSESQSQVFEIYEHLKTKELEGLFQKILDDAHGDISEVKKYASLAESVGWKDFLENHF